MIQIRMGRARTDGSCNACTRQINNEGTLDEPVFVVRLQGTEFRLCDPCLDELWKGLDDARKW